jgi:hypothetical protein
MTADETMVKKATNDVAARVVAEDSTAKAMTMEKAAEESTTQEATEMEVMKKAAEESTCSSSSLNLGVGSKRAAMSGGSTPPSKWFCYAWVPWYVEWFSHFFFSLFTPYLTGIFPVQRVSLWRDTSSRQVLGRGCSWC